MLHIDLRTSQSTAPTPEKPKILQIYGYVSIKMLTLKILESWKIQFTNTLLIALL